MSDARTSEQERIKSYIGKIATGPNQSKDLTEEEAEDALGLILNNRTSPVQSAILLIAARMKRETLEENIGYWRALDRTTQRQLVKVDRLLQVADPFDGFDRVPYFGFYALPVIAAMGLPTYGHSALTLPPKFGITFQDILHQHYKVPFDFPVKKLVRFLEENGFAIIGLQQSHRQLDALRGLRIEMVKRSVLSTFEKMLMPLQSAQGANYLATSYFHRGYEVPMGAVARLSEFDVTAIGNGMEGTTLYGVHKPATVFVVAGNGEPKELQVSLEQSFAEETGQKIREAYEELKQETSRLETLTAWGETALKGGTGPASILIACQAATFATLFGLFLDPQAAFKKAEEILRQGTCYERFMRFVELR
ncbi:MAG: hypothetical protein VYC17_02550 [Nitrospinota bacterium]|nr:hypothetical protein [Nitrospinota bacterium]